MKHLPLVFLVSASVVLSCASTQHAAAAEVKLTRADDRVRVEVGGRLFTEYVFKGAYRPYCYPVLAADGTGLTRDFPMKQNTGEDGKGSKGSKGVEGLALFDVCPDAPAQCHGRAEATGSA